jgi:hypothetical protein
MLRADVVITAYVAADLAGLVCPAKPHKNG